MYQGLHRLVAVPMILMLAACGTSSDEDTRAEAGGPRMETIAGTLSYAEEINLAPETTVTVRLVDLSQADTPQGVIAETVFHKPGKPPVPFSIRYDASKIESGRRYGLQAEVMEQKRLMFFSNGQYPVLDGRNQPPVDMTLARVPGGNPDRIPEKVRANNPELVGHYSYRDGAGVFVDCADGSVHPVAREQGVFALESEYRDVAPRFGDEVFIRLSGKYVTRPATDGRGKQDFLIALLVEEMSPGTGCP